MSDPRINDPDTAGPGGEFLNPDEQDPETASSGDSETGIRSPDQTPDES